MAGASYSDLTEQASIYASYHHNIWNRIIHFIFVPLILLGTTLWLSYPLPAKVPVDLASLFPGFHEQAFIINIGMILAVILSLYYASLDVLVSLIIFIMLFAFAFLSNVTLAVYGAKQVFWFGFICQVVGWSSQVVIGHGYFEGRKAAVTDSLFQALVAPFFVVLEILFLFGYRPKLAAEIEKRADIKIKEWKASKKSN